MVSSCFGRTCWLLDLIRKWRRLFGSVNIFLGRAFLMPRPKCIGKTVSDRHPAELRQDVEDAAAKLRVTSSEWRKQALEFKLKLAWVIQADWYKLRQLDPWTLRKRGATLSDVELSDVHLQIVG